MLPKPASARGEARKCIAGKEETPLKPSYPPGSGWLDGDRCQKGRCNIIIIYHIEAGREPVMASRPRNLAAMGWPIGLDLVLSHHVSYHVPFVFIGRQVRVPSVSRPGAQLWPCMKAPKILGFGGVTAGRWSTSFQPALWILQEASTTLHFSVAMVDGLSARTLDDQRIGPITSKCCYSNRLKANQGPKGSNAILPILGAQLSISI